VLIVLIVHALNVLGPIYSVAHKSGTWTYILRRCTHFVMV